MKTMLLALVFALLGLTFGCTTGDTESLPDEAAAEGVGQVEQAICATCDPADPPTSTCDCPLGTYWTGSYCSGFSVGPGYVDACYASCQCPSGYYCNGSPGLCVH